MHHHTCSGQSQKKCLRRAVQGSGQWVELHSSNTLIALELGAQTLEPDGLRSNPGSAITRLHLTRGNSFNLLLLSFPPLQNGCHRTIYLMGLLQEPYECAWHTEMLHKWLLLLLLSRLLSPSGNPRPPGLFSLFRNRALEALRPSHWIKDSKEAPREQAKFTTGNKASVKVNNLLHKPNLLSSQARKRMRQRACENFWRTGREQGNLDPSQVMMYKGKLLW